MTLVKEEVDQATRRRPRSDATKAISLIEAANALSLPAFRQRFLPDYPLQGPMVLDIAALQPEYRITLESSSTIPSLEFTACFNLVADTSSEAYSNSTKGWSPSRKRKEMRLPDLRYLLVKPTSSPDSPVEGFMSFMFTYEDGHEVVYCYEIHIAPRLQGYGVGKYLMGLMHDIGRRSGVEKAMLTVFLENKGALAFYEKLGYREDEYSPGPRKLRNGVVKKPGYIILSKSLK